MSTLILQSHRKPLPFTWLEGCLGSVERWAAEKGYSYHYMGDELFDPVREDILKKTRQQKVIATDLARLKWIQHFLTKGYDTVVWCDADFLIFSPQHFDLPTAEQLPENYAIGRETWVQPHGENGKKIKAFKKVHNAFMLYRRGNHFLDFYTAHAERQLETTEGPMPPQFIGPKLLTAIHNVVQCPVMESAGMFSPLVIKNILAGGGSALDLFKQKSAQPVSAANLCTSMFEAGEVSDTEMADVIALLTANAEPI